MEKVPFVFLIRLNFLRPKPLEAGSQLDPAKLGKHINVIPEIFQYSAPDVGAVLQMLPPANRAVSHSIVLQCFDALSHFGGVCRRSEALCPKWSIESHSKAIIASASSTLRLRMAMPRPHHLIRLRWSGSYWAAPEALKIQKTR